MESDSKNILLKNNIQPTNQRVIILDYIRKSTEHPSCNNIYEDLSKIYPIMNLTTIYNTVNLLVKKNIIGEIYVDDKCHYGIKEKDHSHFICKKCKKIIDLDADVKKEVNLNGYIIEEQNISYKGICLDCKSKQ